MTVIPSTGINFGFTANDLLSNSQGIVAGLAGFILLAVGVAFAPRLFSLVTGLFRRGRH